MGFGVARCRLGAAQRAEVEITQCHRLKKGPSSDTNHTQSFPKRCSAQAEVICEGNYKKWKVRISGRRNCFYDLRMLNDENRTNNTSFQIESVLERESSLKFQTRCVRFFPDGHGFCLGSIEGRVGVEFLDALADSRMLAVAEKPKKYAFKCHRDSNSGLVYPVNAIDFHPQHRQTFATGGCDGTVVLWDGQNKKKLTALPAFPTSISAMCFSPDGRELAIASSYTHEEGDREQHPQDELYIRQILDSEATPKTK